MVYSFPGASHETFSRPTSARLYSSRLRFSSSRSGRVSRELDTKHPCIQFAECFAPGHLIWSRLPGSRFPTGKPGQAILPLDRELVNEQMSFAEHIQQARERVRNLLSLAAPAKVAWRKHRYHRDTQRLDSSAAGLRPAATCTLVCVTTSVSGRQSAVLSYPAPSA